MMMNILALSDLWIELSKGTRGEQKKGLVLQKTVFAVIFSQNVFEIADKGGPSLQSVNGEGGNRV